MMTDANRQALKTWAVDTELKAVKTFAHTAGGLLTGASTHLVQASWAGYLATAGASALLAILQNIEGLPSFKNEE